MSGCNGVCLWWEITGQTLASTGKSCEVQCKLTHVGIKLPLTGHCTHAGLPNPLSFFTIDVPYSTMIGWVRCRLSFALLRASIMSIRGARSSRHRPVLLESVEVQVAEGHI